MDVRVPALFMKRSADGAVPCRAVDVCSVLVTGQNEQVRIALSLPAIRGRGLRVLAMDGGGMKGESPSCQQPCCPCDIASLLQPCCRPLLLLMPSP